MGLKKTCCYTFARKGKACKRCPLICALSRNAALELLDCIEKKKARRRFEKRYLS